MVQLRTISAPKKKVDVKKLGFFRYGTINDKKILTNDAGEWHFLSNDDFEVFLKGNLPKDHEDYDVLVEKGFIRDGWDVENTALKIRRKKSFVGQGPHLHIVITTLRCNQSCKYCHASRTTMDRVDTDMTIETATKVVDHAMQSTSPYVNFEFQGGEPTINFDVLKHIVEYSRELNKTVGKEVDHSLVTNMTYMKEDVAEWLVDNNIWVCTSLDGTEEVHNFNRTWTKSQNAYASVLKWIKHFNNLYIERGYDPDLYHVDALMTTTKKTLEHWKDIVHLYLDLNIRNIHLRPLNPYGFVFGTWKLIGYSMTEYLDFYAQALDYILELNMQGKEMIEGTASIFLKKILTPDDPNFVDMLSPCGAGTGQVAYNYDGTMFTCDEGRMTDAMGNNLFAIGQVGETSYVDMIQHPTVKAMAVASLQDSLPSCNTCWNKPFCGVCPMHNYMSGGDIFGQRPRSPKCTEYYTISSLILDKLHNDKTGDVERIFRRWITTRPRIEPADCSR